MELPVAFIEKYQQLLGESEATAFLASFAEQAVTGFRLNPKKVSTTKLENIRQEFQSIPWSSNGFYGKSSGHSMAQISGSVYSQEPSAQAVATLADPQANWRVLDLCAAPGGKTTQLATLLNETGLLVANEIDGQRVKALSENVERFGYSNVVVTNHDPDRLAELLPNFFDQIVIDAPCSGEGMFRKDPDAMQYWSPEYVQQCQDRQRAILAAALKMLKPNGQLVYSTCTFSPEEDEENIAWLLANYPALSTVVPTQTWPGVASGRPEWGAQNAQLVNARRFWPQQLQGEGHFMVKLQAHDLSVAASNFAVSQKPAKKKARRQPVASAKLDKNQQALFDQFMAATFVQTPSWLAQTLQLKGDQLFAVPTELAPITALKFVRRGLWLGEFRKNRFVPNHALVMATALDQFNNIIELTDEQLPHYLHGETINLSQQLPKGWYPVVYQQQIFSWGYLVGQTLKNFYPKNLRF